MKRKILKKVCEMSKYLTLIPITKRNVFSLLSFLFGEKNNYDSGKLKFRCIFFW